MEDCYHIFFYKLPEKQLERKKLGDLLTIVGGGTPSTKCPEYWTKEGGIPWIGISDLTANKGKFIERGEINITETGKRSSITKLIPEDSILFSMRGTLGEMSLNDRKLCFNQDLIATIFLEKRFFKNYFWFLLKSNKNELISFGRGTTIRGISQKNFKEFLVDLPPQQLIEKFNQICEPFFQIQKTNEREIRELLKLQKYFIELTT